MELTERVSALQSSAQSQLPALNSLKKTETALILPFFSALGYDPFDVREVEPDFDVGLEEQGMKTVDYALKREGVPLMLFQCEEAKTNLGAYDNRFLFQHFDELEAEVVVFTNGVSYRFYANLEAGFDVYERPFLEFDLLDHGLEEIENLKRFTQSVFDTEEILSAAYNVGGGRLLRDYFSRQQESPSEHLVRFMAAQIYEEEISEDVVERFRPVVQRVLGKFINDESVARPSVAERENRSTTPNPEESSKPEEDLELTSSEEESFSDEDEVSAEEEGTDQEEGEEDDPFEKDLARRVLEDF